MFHIKLKFRAYEITTELNKLKKIKKKGLKNYSQSVLIQQSKNTITVNRSVNNHKKSREQFFFPQFITIISFQHNNLIRILEYISHVSNQLEIKSITISN